MPETVIDSCSIVVSAGKLCFNRPIKDAWQLKGKREERKSEPRRTMKMDNNDYNNAKDDYTGFFYKNILSRLMA